MSGGTAGDDDLTGGTGNDTFTIRSTGDVLIEDLTTGDNFTVASTTGSLIAQTTAGFTAAAGDTNSKSLADVIIFSSVTAKGIDMTNSNTSFGYTIEGDRADTDGDEDNVLKGSSKPDILQGYGGVDSLTGNGGADIFKFDNEFDGTAGATEDFTAGGGTDVEDSDDGDTITLATGGVDTIVDFIDGTDTIDTGSTNNFTVLNTAATGNSYAGLTENNNYGIRGSLSGDDFTTAYDGDDVLVFKSSNAGTLADVTTEKFFLVVDAFANSAALEAEDFV